MLSYKQESMIREILQGWYAEEFTLTLMNEFAEQSPDNCHTLIRSIDRLAYKMMELQQKETSSALHAAFMVIAQRAFNKKDYKTYFASMVPICKALFPSGTAEGESLAHQKYFDEFVKLLQDPKAFDIKRDKSWTEQYGYLDYLMLVMKKTEKGGV